MIVHESFYDDYCYNSSLFLLVKAFFSPLAPLTRFQERVAFVSVGLRLANSFILRLFFTILANNDVSNCSLSSGDRPVAVPRRKEL